MSKCELEVNGKFSFTCDDGCGIVCDATPTAAPGGGVIKCLCFCGNEPPTVCLAEEPTGGNQPTVASVAASIAASTQVAIALNEVRLQQAAAWLNYVSPHECYVPVSRLEEKVQLSTSGTLEEIANKLGLRYERVARG